MRKTTPPAKDQIAAIDLEAKQLDAAIQELLGRKARMLEQVLALENGLRSLDARVQALSSKRSVALNFQLPLTDADRLRNQYAVTPTPAGK